MENEKLNNNNFVNNNGKGIEFDAFLKSLLHHNKSKKNKQNQQNKNINRMSNSNNIIHQMINNNYNINLKKSKNNNNLLIGNNSNSFINPTLNENTNNNNNLSKNKRNTKMLFETFSNKNFLTLDQLIELNNGKMKNSNNNNISKIENKYNSTANINWNSNAKSKTYNKSYEKLLHFNSNYNLILSNQFNLLNQIKNENEKSILNIKKIQIEKKKFKNKHNLSSTKLFRTFDKNNTIFSQKDYQENILTDGNNMGELISSFKNNLKESQKVDRKQIKKNKNESYQILFDNKNNKNNTNNISKEIIYGKDKNTLNKNNTFDKIKNNNLINNLNNNIIKIINKKKLNKNKRNNATNKNILQEKYNRISLVESSMYKKKNHSCPNNLNFIKINKKKDKNNDKIRNKEMKINKPNITMNNNYIFNNIQTKYNLTSVFNKKEQKQNNNNNTNNNCNNNTNLFLKSLNYNEHKKSRNKFLDNKSDIINKTYNFGINIKKYKIVKVASFYYKNKNKKEKDNNKNILLNNINELYDKKIILFFIKIINVYRNVLLTQRKKEKLLLDEIIEKNNEIKKIKYDCLKMLYYFELEMKNKFDNSKNIVSKKLKIEKQLLEENKYLRNLAVSKNNVYTNFYSSYEGSCEGLLNIMEKEFNNINNNNIKNNIKNSKNGTANNSPQVTKRHYINNNDFLFINRKKKFRNFYIKKRKKEIK